MYDFVTKISQTSLWQDIHNNDPFKVEIPPDDEPIQVPNELLSESDSADSDEDVYPETKGGLKEQNEDLKAENKKLEGRLGELTNLNDGLSSEIEKLKKEKEELKAELTAFKRAVEAPLIHMDPTSISDPESNSNSKTDDLMPDHDKVIGTEDRPRTLRSGTIRHWTVSKITEELKNGRFKNIVVFTGAGISTDAGIPDFRSPETGLYHKLGAYNLEKPEDIFSLDFFKMNPKPFYTLAKEIMPGTFSPTLTHHFIAMLEEKGLLSHYFTQNIDGLDKIAGVSDEKLILVHGSFDSSHCSVCKESVNNDIAIQAMKNGEPLQCFTCINKGKTTCSWIKPDITFFGEALPDKFYKVLESGALKKCDLLIIIGTSLRVPPATDVLRDVPEDCPRLLINREAVKSHDNIKFLTDEQKGATMSRDVFMKAEANEGCVHLAATLGFKEELFERCLAAFAKSKNIHP